MKKLGKLFKFIMDKKCKIARHINENTLPYLLIESFKRGKFLWTHNSVKQEYVNSDQGIVLATNGESSSKVFNDKSGVLGSTLLGLKILDDSNDFKLLVYYQLKFSENEIMTRKTYSAIPHLDKIIC